MPPTVLTFPEALDLQSTVLFVTPNSVSVDFTSWDMKSDSLGYFLLFTLEIVCH